MKGFGYFENFSDLQKITDKLGKAELVPDEEKFPEQEMDNVTVHLLNDERYDGCGCDCEDEIELSASKPMGSAGTPIPDGDVDSDTIMGTIEGLGLGGLKHSFKKAMTQVEAFEPGQSVDDTGMDDAKERTNVNKRGKMDSSDVKEYFNEVFSKNWGAKSKYQYDNWSGNQQTQIDLGVKKTFDGAKPVDVPQAMYPGNSPITGNNAKKADKVKNTPTSPTVTVGTTLFTRP